VTDLDFTALITYNPDRITADDISAVIYALPGVVDVQVGSLSEPVTETVRWRVQDNVTGHPESVGYDRRETAEAICRGLNTPDAGGRHGVYINEGEGWRRDLG
jgi:hypothetical protein